MSIQTAGMLLFVHTDALDTMEEMVRHVNADTRVSSEVLSIHLVKPTRDAVDELSRSLREQDHLKDMERMNRLKGNNALRDLTAGWRLDESMTNSHKLVVGLETFNPEFKKKYPEPNLTLPAGRIEEGESLVNAAHREVFEETRIKVDPTLVRKYIGLFRGGIRMYTIFITRDTPLAIVNRELYVGDIKRTREFYENFLRQPIYRNINSQSHHSDLVPNGAAS